MSDMDKLVELQVEFLREAARQLKRVQELAERERKMTGFCIGNTTKYSGGDWFFSPILNTFRLIAGSVIVNRVSLAEEIARFLDGKVEYIAVDVEKKIPREQYGPRDVGNIERAVRRTVKKSKLLTFKGNDLTVDAIDCLMGQLVKHDERGLGGKKVVIIGSGNIGFKLALRLVEQGSNVTIVRRDKEKLDTIVKALNYVKPSETMAMISGTTDADSAVVGAQFLIGLTPGTHSISRSMIQAVAPTAVLIDGGKGSFGPDALRCAEDRGLRVYRADIRASFQARVEMLLGMEAILEKNLGRRKIQGVSVVSGGLLGKIDEVVVDNVHAPTQVHGVADGCGDFIRVLSKDQLECVHIVERYISEKLRNN